MRQIVLESVTAPLTVNRLDRTSSQGKIIAYRTDEDNIAVLVEELVCTERTLIYGFRTLNTLFAPQGPLLFTGTSVRVACEKRLGTGPIGVQPELYRFLNIREFLKWASEQTEECVAGIPPAPFNRK